MVVRKLQSPAQPFMDYGLEFMHAIGIQSLYVQPGLMLPSPALIELLLIFIGQSQIDRAFSAIFDIDARNLPQLSCEISIERTARRAELEKVMGSVGFSQRRKDASRGPGSFFS